MEVLLKYMCSIFYLFLDFYTGDLPGLKNNQRELSDMPKGETADSGGLRHRHHPHESGKYY